MLRLSTFTLTDNSARRTYDFYDDKLIWTVKSLTVETEDEIKYENIRVITCKKMITLDWLWRMMWLSAAIVVLNLVLLLRGIDSSTVIAIEKLLMLAGLVLGIISFRRQEYWSFLDKDRKYLATIRVAKKDRHILAKAIELIKQKTNLLSETHPDHPLPSASPEFDIVQYDIPDFLNRSIIMVYQDKIIEVEISLLEELVTEINFQELSGKTKVLRAGNQSWENQWCLGFVIMPTVYVILELFFQSSLSIYILVAGFFLPILLSFLKYVKQEYLLFYNNDERVLFWMIRTQGDQAKVDQIEEYVRQRVLAVKGKF